MLQLLKAQCQTLLYMRVAALLMNTFLMNQNQFEGARLIGATNMDTSGLYTTL